MAECGAEVAVDWVNGLILHEGDTDWHPWDDAIYGTPDHMNGGE